MRPPRTAGGSTALMRHVATALLPHLSVIGISTIAIPFCPAPVTVKRERFLWSVQCEGWIRFINRTGKWQIYPWVCNVQSEYFTFSVMSLFMCLGVNIAQSHYIEWLCFTLTGECIGNLLQSLSPFELSEPYMQRHKITAIVYRHSPNV